MTPRLNKINRPAQKISEFLQNCDYDAVTIIHHFEFLPMGTNVKWLIVVVGNAIVILQKLTHDNHINFTMVEI